MYRQTRHESGQGGGVDSGAAAGREGGGEQGEGKEWRVRNGWWDGQRIGVEFNLLWLEFQNTRWLMHIAFGVAPSRLCSRPPLPPRPPASFATTLQFSTMCVPYWDQPSPFPPPPCQPFAANVNSFCHALSGAKRRPFLPPSPSRLFYAAPLTLDTSVSPHVPLIPRFKRGSLYATLIG